MKIKELCADERPREKMLAKGAGAMSNFPQQTGISPG